MNFSLFMFLALIFTGAVWLLDRLLSAPSRKRKALSLQDAGGSTESVEQMRHEPVLVEYARAFFPVILAVFLLRSFLVEPFRIPSGSMLPNLLIGDFILVNKFAYGVRLPIVNKKIIETDSPERGDVVVFRFPRQPSVNYIKRLVGLPGDRIIYKDKKLYVNGKLMQQSELGLEGMYGTSQGQIKSRRIIEELDGVKHDILLTNSIAREAMEFVIPEGNYFVLGDNRDHSNDSRYWLYVPDENLVGQAFMIWFSWDLTLDWDHILWNRIGNTIH